MTGREAAQPIPRRRSRINRLLWVLAVLGLFALGCAVATLRHKASEPHHVLATAAPDLPDAPGLLRMVVDGSSEVRLQGTTTIGGWASRSSEIRATVLLTMDSSRLNRLFDNVQAGKHPTLPSLPFEVSLPAMVKLAVPVDSFHGSSRGMDRDMRAALKASQHPDIRYVLDSVQSVSLTLEPQSKRPALKVETRGRLIVAGVERRTTLDALIFRDARGRIAVHAAKQLLMSDFSVKPPTALFGLIHAHNSMTVDFDLDFVPARR